MTVYYIVRDVSPDAICSYPRGRTLLNGSPNFTEERGAERLAETYRGHCHCPGVTYGVLAWEETRYHPGRLEHA